MALEQYLTLTFHIEFVEKKLSTLLIDVEMYIFLSIQ